MIDNNGRIHVNDGEKTIWRVWHMGLKVGRWPAECSFTRASLNELSTSRQTWIYTVVIIEGNQAISGPHTNV